MPQFELNRLVSYGEADIVSEIRRVAGLVRSEVLTRRAFDRHSKVSSSTVVRKLGSWESALARAGLAHRYAERTVTEKMRRQTTRTMTNHQLLQEMRRVAAERGGGILTAEEFNRRAAVNSETISRRFGSWKAGLASAGLEVANRGRRYSDEDYFENLLSVWTHYGRQPTYGQMDRAPSTIRAKAYEAKWGTWRKALLAFLERVNSPEQQPKASAEPPQQLRHEKAVASPPLHESPRRAVPLSLRYSILVRDRFRCVLCGSSPASDPGCHLHVDHLTPLRAGGQTEAPNLRTLCERCNLGKGSKLDEVTI